MRLARFLIPTLLEITVAQGGLPMLTDDPGTPARGKWEINIAMTTEKRDGIWSLQAPYLDFNYGFTDTAQVIVDIPYLIQSIPNAADVGAVGNAVLGMKWRFIESAALDVSICPKLGFNTSHRAVDEGLVSDGMEFDLPIEFSHDIDDKTCLFGEMGAICLEHGDDGFFAGCALQRQVTDSLTVLAELFAQDANDFNDPELLVNVGIHWQAREHLALLGSIGTGLAEGAAP